MRKLTALLAGGIGYVLGARAGRQRYEQLRQAATRVKSNPKVQQTAQQAKEAAPVIKDKVSGAATAATSKVRHTDSSSTSGTSTSGTSSAGTSTPMATTEPTAASTASTTTPSTITGSTTGTTSPSSTTTPSTGTSSTPTSTP